VCSSARTMIGFLGMGPVHWGERPRTSSGESDLGLTPGSLRAGRKGEGSALGGERDMSQIIAPSEKIVVTLLRVLDDRKGRLAWRRDHAVRVTSGVHWHLTQL